MKYGVCSCCDLQVYGNDEFKMIEGEKICWECVREWEEDKGNE